jgi:hypothetical protein
MIQWRALVNSVMTMSFRVPISDGEFLDNLSGPQLLKAMLAKIKGKGRVFFVLN